MSHAPPALRAVAAYAVCLLPQQARSRDGGVRAPLALNRVLVERAEVDWTAIPAPRATLPKDDPRAVHVREVLRKVGPDETLRAGVTDAFLVDQAPVTVHADLSVSFELPADRSSPTPPIPSITLLLALPRPKVLARLLPQIAAVGVKQIVLVNAYKVERCYFDSDIIRNLELARHALIDGVMQSGVDAYVPRVSVEKRLKVFLEDRLQTLIPNDTVRIIAEPDASGARISDVIRREALKFPLGREAVLAVGPEGGWMPREIFMLEQLHGFHRVSLGHRILRTDSAVLILLGLVHDAMSRDMVRLTEVDGENDPEQHPAPIRAAAER
jgi:16S rRNA (uracil1498-N3)-methyltransferase